MARETPEPGPPGRAGAPDLGALLGALAPAAEAPLAAALDELLDALIGGASAGQVTQGRAARALVAALVMAGAEGAELWLDEVGPAEGWRRLAAAGPAVPDAARRVAGQHQGYAGAVAVVRVGSLALAFSGAHPGSDERERREDLAETLLTAAVACGAADALDWSSGPDGPRGPLGAS